MNTEQCSVFIHETQTQCKHGTLLHLLPYIFLHCLDNYTWKVSYSPAFGITKYLLECKICEWKGRRTLYSYQKYLINITWLCFVMYLSKLVIVCMIQNIIFVQFLNNTFRECHIGKYVHQLCPYLYTGVPKIRGNDFRWL